MQLSDRIGRRMKLHDIHVLMAVVQAGSMGKAAAFLNTTQSAISRTMADLESAVGVQLLDRGPQGVEPTQYGRALLKRGVAVFDELKQGIQDIEFLSDPTAGELRIGSGIALAEGIVLAVIERLSRQYPRLAFHIELGDTLTLYDELRERRIELGFARTSGRILEEDMDAEVLFEEPLVVVASIKSPWAQRRKIKLAELMNEPWTWSPRGTLVDSLIGDAFRASGLTPPRASVYTHATNVRIRLAATGGFLAVVANSLLKFSTTHTPVKVLPVELPTTQGQIGIITLKHRTLSPVAQLFIEHAREVARPMAKRKR